MLPYIQKLNELAINWNLRDSWASEKLFDRNVQRAEADVIKAAGATPLFKLSDQQIQQLFNHNQLPSDTLPINMVSLYLAGGRLGFINKLNKRLKELEQELKAAGAMEPPSALRIHAEWWFDHYVYNMKFSDISDKLALNDNEGGPEPKNIGKAALKFSEFLNIEPIERT